MWASKAFGGGENGGSGAEGPPDTMALMCTADAKAKIGCFFKYIWYSAPKFSNLWLPKVQQVLQIS